MKNRNLVAVVLVVACALGAYISRHDIARAFAGGSYDRSEGAARERRLNQLSFTAFEGAELGMSYPDVVELVGVGGTEVTRDVIGDSVTVTYRWERADGTAMTTTFRDDRLISKSQNR